MAEPYRDVHQRFVNFSGVCLVLDQVIAISHSRDTSKSALEVYLRSGGTLQAEWPFPEHAEKVYLAILQAMGVV